MAMPYCQSELTFQRSWTPVSSQLDGPADYRPQMVPVNARNDHGQPSSQVHQQQRALNQYTQQQQWRYHQTQPPQTQTKPAHQANAIATPLAQSKQYKPVHNAVTTLLPYCTADIPLNESQVIAVTDVAASLKELVHLALGARDGDAECMDRLVSALGSEQAVAGVVDFFCDEFECE